MIEYSTKYTSLEDFLNDIPHNEDLKFIIEKMAKTTSFGWHQLSDLFGKNNFGNLALKELAFNREDTMYFSDGNLKVCYIFDEDFINNGSSILLFSLVGSDWSHLIRLENQVEYFKYRSIQ